MAKRRRKKNSFNFHFFIILILLIIMSYAGFLFYNFLKDNGIITQNKNNKKSNTKIEKPKNKNPILTFLENLKIKSQSDNSEKNQTKTDNNKDNIKNNNSTNLPEILVSKNQDSTDNKNTNDVTNIDNSNNNISNNSDSNNHINNNSNNNNNNDIYNSDNNNDNDNNNIEKSSDSATTDENNLSKDLSQTKEIIKTKDETKKITIHYGNFYIYLCVVDEDGDLHLKKIKQKIKYTDSPIFSTISSLIKIKKEGYLNLIPEGTILKEAWIKNGILYLNFNKAFLNNTYGLKAIDAQIKQIVKTATQFNNVKGVRFQINGKTIKYFSDEGYLMDIVFH